jgi:para-aminobenzoate synthetase/4-amino-4-deoxychorismate lyase
MGIGSGIVHDSDGPSEYDECLLKAAFASGREEPFELIETMRWERGSGFWLLDRHMRRLGESAAYFGYRFDDAEVREALSRKASTFEAPLQRVRLTLAEDGGIHVAATAMAPVGKDAVLRYAVAAGRTSSADRFLFHKTTRRRFYDETRERLMAETGCDEALFLNERDELTEGSFTNLFIERNGRLLTPPIGCGLLNGTLRGALLADPERKVEEQVLRLADLQNAERVFLGNSVRGLVRAVAVDAPAVGKRVYG